ncbi:UNVERIFIED_CONTAM: hypothetical protein Sradi_5681000 [Sesamum radiatum]|uniref:Uncharacterized protein n=1 Tax=Sesamum radiatum TaxID=300843 RepID=A0AAW2L327_SESRA
MMSEELHEKQEIIFGSEDLEKDAVTNNDAVVISVTIANFWVKKVLVDNGSSADIIFYKAFSQMGINNAELTKVNTPLTSFSGSIVEPIGEVMLPPWVHTKASNQDDKVPCRGRPFRIQCDIRKIKPKLFPSNSFNISPEAEIPNPQRSR